MPLKFGTPPRTRENNLIDYPSVIAELRAHPEAWAEVAVVAKTDADRIVRTLKGVGGLEIMTRAANTPGKEDGRAVWVRSVESGTPKVSNAQASE